MSSKSDNNVIIEYILDSLTEDEQSLMQFYILGRYHTFRELLIDYLSPLKLRYNMKKSLRITSIVINDFWDYSNPDAWYILLSNLKEQVFKLPLKERNSIRSRKRRMKRFTKTRKYPGSSN